MRQWSVGAACFVAGFLVACGGGGGSGSGGGTSGSGTTYPFVTPQVNVQRTYSESYQDNQGNTINLTLTSNVSAVNSDGSYALEQETSSEGTVDGWTYGFPPRTTQVNNAGQTTSYSYTNSSGVAVTCTYNPHSAGPNFPLSVGETWTVTFTGSCNGGTSVSYAQNGSVVDVESLTVPAGTFTTVRLQSTITWTDAHGTTHTETETNWRDVKTMFSVKQSLTYAYSGVAPATVGYPVSEEIERQSGP